MDHMGIEEDDPIMPPHESNETQSRHFPVLNTGRGKTTQNTSKGQSIPLSSCIRVHDRKLMYSCGECGKEFTRKRNAILHTKIHSGVKKYTCKECGKKFFTDDSLRVHLKLHTNKRFICEYCGRKFARNHYLVIHIRTHTSERNFACDVCNKKFYAKRTMLDHARTHTGEKIFSCHECGKKFTWKSSLDVHMGAHQAVKNFSCEACGQGFVLKRYLVAHLKTHMPDRENSFVCSKCQKPYKSLQGLMYHCANACSHRGLECHTCKMDFGDEKALRDHQVFHDGGQLEDEKVLRDHQVFYNEDQLEPLDESEDLPDPPELKEEPLKFKEEVFADVGLTTDEQDIEDCWSGADNALIEMNDCVKEESELLSDNSDLIEHEIVIKEEMV